MDAEAIRREITTAALEDQKEYQVLLQWLWENHTEVYSEWKITQATIWNDVRWGT